MNTKQHRYAKAMHALKTALAGVQVALRDWAQNPLSYTSVNELGEFQEKLQAMIRTLEDNAPREVPGLWRSVLDTWPYACELRRQIIAAELAYERLE